MTRNWGIVPIGTLGITMDAQAAGRIYESANAAYALPGMPTIGGEES